jgi:tetraacyldisaccharide 4'-kinase
MPLKKVDRLVRNLWYTKTGLRFILWPLSLIFKSIIILRKAAYQIGIKKVTRFNCPVIVVGNITVGGTGKTPLILALAHFLTEKGLHPGIITRGYKGRVKKPELMFADSDPHHVGDEALLLARRSNCPVVVCPDRVAAANYLLQKTKCNVILSDDGLQHFALGRKIEIAVIDGTLGFGNGMLLPAGPLREPPSRLKTVDFCVVCQPENTSHLSSPSPLAQGHLWERSWG